MSAPQTATVALLAQEAIGPSWWLYALIAAAAAIVLYFAYYQLLVRLPLWLWSHLLYRIHVYGPHHIPASGGRLMVCNHVS